MSILSILEPASTTTQMVVVENNRVFNYQELTFVIEGGRLVQDGDEYSDMRTALVPGS